MASVNRTIDALKQVLYEDRLMKIVTNSFETSTLQDKKEYIRVLRSRLDELNRAQREIIEELEAARRLLLKECEEVLESVGVIESQM